MKRTPLRRKSRLKVTNHAQRGNRGLKGRNKAVKPISKLKKDLWKCFSAYIRKRDKNICFICGKRAEGSAYHASHFIPKSVGGLILYFNEDNVHGCCYHDNINLGGNLYEYSLRLGKEKVDELYALKGVIFKVNEQWYLDKIEYYKDKIEKL